MDSAIKKLNGLRDSPFTFRIKGRDTIQANTTLLSTNAILNPIHSTTLLVRAYGSRDQNDPNSLVFEVGINPLYLTLHVAALAFLIGIAILFMVKGDLILAAGILSLSTMIYFLSRFMHRLAMKSFLSYWDVYLGQGI